MIRWMTIAAFGAGLFLATGTGLADDKADAKKHFKIGLSLLKADKFEAAALEFETSVKLYPTKGGRFNLANSYKALSRYEEALDELARLRIDHKDEISDEMREAARGMEDEIHALVGWLTVEATPAGAAVTVDGKKVGSSPLEKALLVDPGKHSIEVTLDGYEPRRAEILLVAGQKESVQLVLHEKAPVEAGEEEEEEEEGGKKLGPVPLIIAGAMTVGFGVTSIVLNKKIGDKSDEAKSAGDDDLMKEAESLQTAGKVMVGLTAASLATAAVLLFFTDFKGGEEELVSDTAWRVDGVSPILTGDGGGLALYGRF